MEENTFTDKSIDRIRSIQHGNFFDYLSSAYEVLRKIFSYLSLDELEIVSEAFEKWKPVVKTAIKERSAIDSFLITFKWRDCTMRSQADFCLTFFMQDNNALETKLQKHLTDNAQFIMIESRPGVIGTSSDLSQIIEGKFFNFNHPPGDTPIATHLRLPSIPEVGIKTFVWNRKVGLEEFKNSFVLPENKTIKCLILLNRYDDITKDRHNKDRFIYYLQNSQTEGFAVGGCIVDSFPENPEASTKYIVFYGDNVEAASTVLDKNVQTKDVIQSQMSEFKSLCPKTDKGVLFVFRCCSRHKVSRQSHIKRNLINWEYKALMTYFSSTPIIGCYGYGEYGRNYPENESLSAVQKRSKPAVVWEYSYATSIVYIGFKK